MTDELVEELFEEIERLVQKIYELQDALSEKMRKGKIEDLEELLESRGYELSSRRKYEQPE